MLNRYLIFDRAESHWMHIGYDSKSSAQRAAKKMRDACGDPSRYVVIDQNKRLPDEPSPAVKKAMARFHQRLDELKAAGPTEYEQLKAAGLSDHNITMLRNTGASFRAILAFAKAKAEDDWITRKAQEEDGCSVSAVYIIPK